MGDTIEHLLSERFGEYLGDWCGEYSSEFGRRSMADMAFTDAEGHYSVVDVKTHRSNSNFNMPNLTSVHRLADLYESNLNTFALLIITYSVKEDSHRPSTSQNSIAIESVRFTPIEFPNYYQK